MSIRDTTRADNEPIEAAGGAGDSAYGIVKAYVRSKAGKFTGADAIGHCPGVGHSSALAPLKRL